MAKTTTVMTYMALLMLLVAGTSQAIDPRLDALDAVHRMLEREDRMMGQAELAAARHLTESTVELDVTDLGRLQIALDSYDMDTLATVTGRLRDVHM